MPYEIKRKHVLLLSFPSYGHLIPLLEFGKKISKYHHVSFVVSSTKVIELRKRELITKDPENDLEIVSVDDGYLEEWDNVSDYSPKHHMIVWQDMFAALIPPTVEFMKTCLEDHRGTVPDNASSIPPVDVVIADSFYGGPLAVCQQRNVPFYIFNSANAGFALGVLSTTEDSPVCDGLEDYDPFFREPKPGCPQQKFMDYFKEIMLKMKNVFPHARGIVINSFRAVEEDRLNILSKFPEMASLTVSCVGPIVPEVKNVKASDLAATEQVRKWLNAKRERSVAYASFGSIAVPSLEQIEELGEALMLLNKPFILSLRTKFHKHLPREIQDQIVNQMEDSDGNVLVLPWLPQKVILAHPATGVFVSHCGWNSTLESLFSGVPIVGWPLFAEQLVNAEWLERHGLGRLIQGTGVKAERLVLAEEIKQTISTVAGWGGVAGTVNNYLSAAQSWKEKIQAAVAINGSSQKEFDELVKFD